MGRFLRPQEPGSSARPFVAIERPDLPKPQVWQGTPAVIQKPNIPDLVPDRSDCSALLSCLNKIENLRMNNNDHVCAPGWVPDERSAGSQQVLQSAWRRKSYAEVWQVNAPAIRGPAVRNLAESLAVVDMDKAMTAWAASEYKDTELIGGVALTLAIRAGQCHPIVTSS